MRRELLIGLLILSPFASLVIPLIRSLALRNALIGAICGILVVCSIVLGAFGQGQISVSMTGPFPWMAIAEIVDYGLLLYFAYLGFVRKSYLVVGLAAAQLVPLAYLKFGARAELAEHVLFRADSLGIMMVLIVCLVGSAIVLFAVPYMQQHESHHPDQPSKQPRFFTLLVLFLGAMNGLLLCNNLYIVYLFWEITTLCCVLLIGHDGTRQATANSTRALWMNSIGGLAFVIALVWLNSIGEPLSISSMLDHKDKSSLLVPVGFLCLAGATKAAQLPFQGWLLGAMVAPTPVSALLHSSTMVKAGVYLVLRLSPVYHESRLTFLVGLVGAFTFAATAMLAISQVDGKRVLAYSTISNLGLIVVCAGINSPVSYSVGMMLILFHAVSKALLFVTTGIIESSIGSRVIEDMSGLIAYMPFTTVVAVIGILSMFLPPFGMFVAKWAALEAAASSPIVVVLIVMGSTFTIVFWTKWMGRMLGTWPTPGDKKIEKLHVLYRVPLVILTSSIILVSLSVMFVVQNIVQPAVLDQFAQAGASAAKLGVQIDTGTIPIILITIVLALSIIVPAVWVRKPQDKPYSVYLCGEQGESEETLTFRSAQDELQEINIGFYYFDKLFGERTHNAWLNSVATLLLAAMVGVSLL